MTGGRPHLDYILPVHNEASRLTESVERLVEGLVARDLAARILLVENGSSDDSASVVRTLEGTGYAREVLAFVEPEAGLGIAYRRGVAEALALDGPNNRWLVLTAADLPFGFTDVDAFLPMLETHGVERGVIIGSKAHPDSDIPRSWQRQLASRAYRIARSWIASIRAGDSQGVFFVDIATAKALAPQIRADDFFYTTELTFVAEQSGVQVLEVPVRYEGELRASTVRLGKHGFTMLRQLVELRRRRQSQER